MKVSLKGGDDMKLGITGGSPANKPDGDDIKLDGNSAPARAIEVAI